MQQCDSSLENNTKNYICDKDNDNNNSKDNDKSERAKPLLSMALRCNSLSNSDGNVRNDGNVEM